jgi:hypothetical protein
MVHMRGTDCIEWHVFAQQNFGTNGALPIERGHGFHAHLASHGIEGNIETMSFYHFGAPKFVDDSCA